MKTIKIAVVAALLLIIQSVSNAAIDPNVKTKLNTQISEMLSKIDLSESENFSINFLINKDNEIIVTSTTNVEFDNVIKSLLNYKKLEADGVEVNKIFTLPVTIKKGN